VAGWWFSLDTLFSPTYKTDSHNITKILLKVALNTLTSNLSLIFILQVTSIRRILKIRKKQVLKGNMDTNSCSNLRKTTTVD
jgi:hypothetical protein